MLDSIFRTLFIYITLLIVMRVMGKREVGQLSPFDLVVAIVIAELAALPMSEKHISLFQGIIPILTLMVAEVILSWICLKSIVARKLISGKPSIIVVNGKIDEAQMRRSRYNIHDLLTQLRDKGFANISDVEFAILETSGRLSVIPKSQKRQVTPEDLHLATPYEGLSVPLIIDGKVFSENLEKTGLTEKWLEAELKKKGINSAEDVLFASIDTKGQLYVSKKGEIKINPAKIQG
ncbi:MAG: DUF421 domain-containing protein [Bacillota bacterium]